MGVLHLLGTAGDGGAETYFVDLVGALDRAGVRQVAAIRRHPGRDVRMAYTTQPLNVISVSVERSRVLRQSPKQLQSPARPPHEAPSFEEILDPLPLADPPRKQKRAARPLPLFGIGPEPPGVGCVWDHPHL